MDSSRRLHDSISREIDTVFFLLRQCIRSLVKIFTEDFKENDTILCFLN